MVNYVKAIDAHELCSKIGNCDEEDMPELVVELGKSSVEIMRNHFTRQHKIVSSQG